MHSLILPTSRHGLSLSKFNASRSVCHMYPTYARSGQLRPPRSIGTVRSAPSFQPNRTSCLWPRREVVEDRARSARGQTSKFLPSPLLYASLWRGHFTDLPGFADVQFDCNNETCMSICPSSHSVAPLEKSVSSQHTVSHRRTMSTWSFGTGQKNHVVCLKSDTEHTRDDCEHLAAVTDCAARDKCFPHCSAWSAIESSKSIIETYARCFESRLCE